MHNIPRWQPIHLENELVKLIPLKENDFHRLYAVASDPKIWEQHPDPDRYQENVFRKNFFNGAIESRMAFLIIDQQTHELMGSTRFYDDKPEEPSIAIGWTFIAHKYWGGVYNRSVKKLMLDHAFHYVDKVYFHIGIYNIRSQMGTAKLGAKRLREFEREVLGKKSMNVEYVISKDDWSRDH
jgi:RimJ/RimL family protein N-acetyltransferase